MKAPKCSECGKRIRFQLIPCDLCGRTMSRSTQPAGFWVVGMGKKSVLEVQGTVCDRDWQARDAHGRVVGWETDSIFMPWDIDDAAATAAVG